MEFNTSHTYILTATCASRMGTTARITGFIAAHRLYIMEMQQFDDVMTKRFFVRVNALLPRLVDKGLSTQTTKARKLFTP